MRRCGFWGAFGKTILSLVALVLCICTTALALTGCMTIDMQHYSDISSELINANSSPNTVKLFDFLKSNYGKYTFSGQYINEYENFSDAKFRVDENDPNSARTVFKAISINNK